MEKPKKTSEIKGAKNLELLQGINRKRGSEGGLLQRGSERKKERERGRDKRQRAKLLV